MRYLTKRNRAILREMVSSDFKVRYQGSVLGYLWSLLRPLFIFATLYVFFVYVFKLNKGIPHYGVYLLLGIVLWTFFIETTTTGMSAVVNRGDLLRKIDIPRYLVVLSSSGSALINLTFNLIVVLSVALFNGLHPHLSWLVLIPILAELFIFGVAVSFFLAALYVKYRDLVYIWEVLTQAGFYGTPILYSIALVPVRIRGYLLMNPIAQMIQDARYNVVTHKAITIWHVEKLAFALIPMLIIIVVAICAQLYFKSQAKYFAENL